MKVDSIVIKVKDMKRIFYIICFITLALFVGVLIRSSSVTDSTNNCKNKEIEKKEFFKITRSESGYFYCIYDKKHNIVKSDGPLIKKPNIKLTDDYLVQFTLQTGTGRATQWGYFYDTENDIFSPFFTSIYDQNNGMVIYGEPNKLIVRDIFDEKMYYKEISAFSRPLSNTADSIIDAKFIENNSIIKISYLTGDDFELVTENIILSE